MRIRNLSLSIPYPSIDFSQLARTLSKVIIHKFSALKIKTLNIYHSFVSMFGERKSIRENAHSGHEFAGKPKFSFSGYKRPLKTLLVVLVAIIIVVGIVKLLGSTRGAANSSTGSPEVKAAKATIQLNKEFSFPLKSAKGETVSNVKFMIENAELRDEIIVNGQRATSIKGREFLILTVKISNEYKSAIQIDTRDYVRLSVNGNENEWLAPDIHNDPVEVQAISTKYTRLGFAINDTDKNLLIRIGEINGDKETTPLEF